MNCRRPERGPHSAHADARHIAGLFRATSRSQCIDAPFGHEDASMRFSRMSCIARAAARARIDGIDIEPATMRFIRPSRATWSTPWMPTASPVPHGK